ncbi:MAG: hypothetical protein DMG06_00625 [Acidobacteria bacterium]|nr:MAG: hypothetical protein DMG06_00625 [Acidobacteriota bacterium]
MEVKSSCQGNLFRPSLFDNAIFPLSWELWAFPNDLLKSLKDRFMKKPKIKWNFEMVFGLFILLVLGLYYVILFFLFLLVKYL